MGNTVNELLEGLGEVKSFLKSEKRLSKRVLSIKPLPQFKAKDIIKIRKRIGASQVAFAELVGAHRRTIEAWETGQNKPSGPASRLLQLLDEDITITQNHFVLAEKK